MWLLLPHPAAHGCSGAVGARVTPGKPCHGEALLWQHQFVPVPAAALGCYQLLPLPAVSHGGLVVTSSTVGTALPIPTPSPGAAGHSGKHLVKAACVSQPELMTMSTFKQCFARVPGPVPFPRPLVQPAHTFTWSWAVTLQPCCLCPVLRHWRGTHRASMGSTVCQGESFQLHSEAAVPGCPGRSQAEQMALPEVRMEPKLSFALAHCGCSYKRRTAGGSQHVGAVLLATRNTKGCTQQPKSTLLPPPPQLPVLSCCPHDAPEPGAGCTTPFSCPHPPLGFWKTRPSGAPEDAGFGCDDLGCRYLTAL